jgi:hypothetical protein
MTAQESEKNTGLSYKAIFCILLLTWKPRERMKLTFKLTLIVIAISMLSSLSVMSFFIYKIVNLNHRTVENTDRILREN